MITSRFSHASREFEIMMETEGKWAGYVHVYDLGKSKSSNGDVVISGARLLGTTLIVTDDDLFEAIPGIVEAAERAILMRVLN